MKIVIREIHPAGSSSALNGEWFVVENGGDKPFSTSGVSVMVGRGPGKPRLRAIGQMDPGFTLQPNERVRVITGNPGKKAHGPVPDEAGLRNYHLFLGAPLIAGAGAVLGLTLHQHELTRARFDAAAPGGVEQGEGDGG